VPGPVRKVAAVVETLEARQLLSAGGHSVLTPKGQLRVTGSRKDDIIMVGRKAGDTGKLEVYVNDPTAPRATFELARITGGIVIAGGNGSDQIEVVQDHGLITVPVAVFGGPGNDAIEGGSGNDILDGGTDNDLVRGGDGDDRLVGAAGDDTLHGNGGNDLVIGGEGSDTISAGSGNDSVDGGNEHDDVFGGDGDDLLLGKKGDDTLTGGNGNDRLEGADGIDTLVGSVGNDMLVGGKSDDELTGSEGDDVFARTDAPEEIMDLTTGDRHRGHRRLNAGAKKKILRHRGA
jgi:Ca2+-binding RTX toxin-like protein